MQVSYFKTTLRVDYPDEHSEFHSVYTRSRNPDKLKLLLYEQNISGFNHTVIVDTEKITVNVPYSILEKLNNEQN